MSISTLILKSALLNYPDGQKMEDIHKDSSDITYHDRDQLRLLEQRLRNECNCLHELVFFECTCLSNVHLAFATAAAAQVPSLEMCELISRAASLGFSLGDAAGSVFSAAVESLSIVIVFKAKVATSNNCVGF